MVSAEGSAGSPVGAAPGDQTIGGGSSENSRESN